MRGRKTQPAHASIDLDENIHARARVGGLGFPAGGEGLDVSFAVMDSEAFALGRTFDAAVIYDALHHFADERAVLANVFAHLVPGGRLFLKEPLEHHPEAPETMAEVAEFGVLEREMPRIVNGQVYMIPGSPETQGHGTTGNQAHLYAQQLADFIASVPKKTN